MPGAAYKRTHQHLRPREKLYTNTGRITGHMQHATSPSPCHPSVTHGHFTTSMMSMLRPSSQRCPTYPFHSQAWPSPSSSCSAPCSLFQCHPSSTSVIRTTLGHFSHSSRDLPSRLACAQIRLPRYPPFPPWAFTQLVQSCFGVFSPRPHWSGGRARGPPQMHLLAMPSSRGMQMWYSSLALNSRLVSTAPLNRIAAPPHNGRSRVEGRTARL